MPNISLPPSAFEALELPPDSISTLTSNSSLTASSSDVPSSSSQALQAPSTSASLNLPHNATSITLYAELLLNIRTVTLFASLRTVHNRETKAELSADGSSITVSHEGESASIRLPTRIQGGGDAGLHLPAEPPSKELTLRLRLEEKDGRRLLRGPDGGLREREGNWVPWSASELNDVAEAKLVCRACEGELVGGGKVREWKDLPNENWAEMMDFWHCHKPSENNHHGHAHGEEIGKMKGYAASNRLRAVQGIGFVDLGAFLVKEEDCKSMKVRIIFAPLVSLDRSYLSNSPQTALVDFHLYAFHCYISRYGRQEGGLRRTPWLGHRYNRPRSIVPYTCSAPLRTFFLTVDGLRGVRWTGAA